MAKMMRSMAAGAMLGMAVSAMVLPQLDRRDRKSVV